jgi:hypothetical protein
MNALSISVVAGFVLGFEAARIKSNWARSVFSVVGFLLILSALYAAR